MLEVGRSDSPATAQVVAGETHDENLDVGCTIPLDFVTAGDCAEALMSAKSRREAGDHQGSTSSSMPEDGTEFSTEAAPPSSSFVGAPAASASDQAHPEHNTNSPAGGEPDHLADPDLMSSQQPHQLQWQAPIAEVPRHVRNAAWAPEDGLRTGGGDGTLVKWLQTQPPSFAEVKRKLDSGSADSMWELMLFIRKPSSPSFLPALHLLATTMGSAPPDHIATWVPAIVYHDLMHVPPSILAAASLNSAEKAAAAGLLAAALLNLSVRLPKDTEQPGPGWARGEISSTAFARCLAVYWPKSVCQLMHSALTYAEGAVPITSVVDLCCNEPGNPLLPKWSNFLQDKPIAEGIEPAPKSLCTPMLLALGLLLNIYGKLLDHDSSMAAGFLRAAMPEEVPAALVCRLLELGGRCPFGLPWSFLSALHEAGKDTPSLLVPLPELVPAFQGVVKMWDMACMGKQPSCQESVHSQAVHHCAWLEGVITTAREILLASNVPADTPVFKEVSTTFLELLDRIVDRIIMPFNTGTTRRSSNSSSSGGRSNRSYCSSAGSSSSSSNSSSSSGGDSGSDINGAGHTGHRCNMSSAKAMEKTSSNKQQTGVTRKNLPTNIQSNNAASTSKSVAACKSDSLATGKPSSNLSRDGRISADLVEYIDLAFFTAIDVAFQREQWSWLLQDGRLLRWLEVACLVVNEDLHHKLLGVLRRFLEHGPASKVDVVKLKLLQCAQPLCSLLVHQIPRIQTAGLVLLNAALQPSAVVIKEVVKTLHSLMAVPAPAAAKACSAGTTSADLVSPYPSSDGAITSLQHHATAVMCNLLAQGGVRDAQLLSTVTSTAQQMLRACSVQPELPGKDALAQEALRLLLAILDKDSRPLGQSADLAAAKTTLDLGFEFLEAGGLPLLKFYLKADDTTLQELASQLTAVLVQLMAKKRGRHIRAILGTLFKEQPGCGLLHQMALVAEQRCEAATSTTESGSVFRAAGAFITTLLFLLTSKDLRLSLEDTRMIYSDPAVWRAVTHCCSAASTGVQVHEATDQSPTLCQHSDLAANTRALLLHVLRPLQPDFDGSQHFPAYKDAWQQEVLPRVGPALMALGPEGLPEGYCLVVAGAAFYVAGGSWSWINHQYDAGQHTRQQEGGSFRWGMAWHADALWCTAGVACMWAGAGAGVLVLGMVMAEVARSAIARIGAAESVRHGKKSRTGKGKAPSSSRPAAGRGDALAADDTAQEADQQREHGISAVARHMKLDEVEGGGGEKGGYREKEEERERKCGECGVEQNAMYLCSRCRAVRYCNAECQRLHWKAHRKVCKQIQQSQVQAQ